MTFESMTEAKDHYEKLCNKNYKTYQECGESRFYDAYSRYEMIVDAMNAYLDAKDEQDRERMRRHKNVQAYIERHLYNPNKTFSHAEVRKMLEEVGNM